MPQYTMIYTTSRIHLLSNTHRKAWVRSIIADNEFRHVDKETNLRNRKHLQALITSDFRRVIFTKCVD